MPTWGLSAGPSFGLNDAKIAVNNLDGTFGTLVDVPSVQMMGVNPQTVNAQLEGDDTITDTHARLISVQVTLRFGSINIAALEVITGLSKVLGGQVANNDQQEQLLFTGLNFPYFGITGMAEATSATGGNVQIFVPKVKIMEGFELTLEYGNYSIPNLTAMAVYDDDYAGIMSVIESEAAFAIAMPPVLNATV